MTCRGSHAGVCWVERRALSSLLPRTCTAVRSSRPSSPTPGSVRPRTSACRSCSCSTPATSCSGRISWGTVERGSLARQAVEVALPALGNRGRDQATALQARQQGQQVLVLHKTLHLRSNSCQKMPKKTRMSTGGIFH